MKTAKDQIVEQMEELLKVHSKKGTIENRYRMAATIERFAPKGSQYIKEVERAIRDNNMPWPTPTEINIIASILTALKDDYAAGYLENISEKIRREMSRDFLDMAEQLLDEGPGYPEAAVVLAGGVLEEHLINLCMKNGINPRNDRGKPKGAYRLNDDLKDKAYSEAVHREIQGWWETRKDGAHPSRGNKVTKRQAERMIDGIREFMKEHPA